MVRASTAAAAAAALAAAAAAAGASCNDEISVHFSCVFLCFPCCCVITYGTRYEISKFRQSIVRPAMCVCFAPFYALELLLCC